MSLTKKELNRILEAAEKVDFNGKNEDDARFTCHALKYDKMRFREEFLYLVSEYQNFIKPDTHTRIRPSHFEGYGPRMTKKAQDHRVIALLMFWAAEGGK